jgi:hypothetical protein
LATKATAEQGDDQPQDSLQPGGATPTMLLVLRATTPEEEVHYRTAKNKRGGDVLVDGQPLQLAYVTARYVQDSLDEIVGPHNWASMFDSLPSGAVRCGISIRMQTGDWITKWDVGVPSSIEPDKGAHSDAFKRAGVQWGIARDLYDERDDREIGGYEVPQEEEKPESAPVPIRQRMTRPTARTQYPRQDAPPRRAPEQTQYREDGPVEEWVCPIHDDVKVVPAGISRKTNRPYNAFYACPVPGCDEKGPSLN